MYSIDRIENMVKSDLPKALLNCDPRYCLFLGCNHNCYNHKLQGNLCIINNGGFIPSELCMKCGDYISYGAVKIEEWKIVILNNWNKRMYDCIYNRPCDNQFKPCDIYNNIKDCMSYTRYKDCKIFQHRCNVDNQKNKNGN